MSKGSLRRPSFTPRSVPSFPTRRNAGKVFQRLVNGILRQALFGYRPIDPGHIEANDHPEKSLSRERSGWERRPGACLRQCEDQRTSASSNTWTRRSRRHCCRARMWHPVPVRQPVPRPRQRLEPATKPSCFCSGSKDSAHPAIHLITAAVAGNLHLSSALRSLLPDLRSARSRSTVVNPSPIVRPTGPNLRAGTGCKTDRLASF